MMKAKFLIPFAIFVVLAGFLFKGLYLDPRMLPSVLINKPLPAFEMSTLYDPAVKFKTEDMKGKVWMLNVWASWCLPCKEEHPYLVGLKRTGLKTRSWVSSIRTPSAPAVRFLKTRAIPTTS